MHEQAEVRSEATKAVAVYLGKDDRDLSEKEEFASGSLLGGGAGAAARPEVARSMVGAAGSFWIGFDCPRADGAGFDSIGISRGSDPSAAGRLISPRERRVRSSTSEEPRFFAAASASFFRDGWPPPSS